MKARRRILLICAAAVGVHIFTTLTMPTKPQRKHVRQMTDLNSKNQFSFADSGLHDALRSLVKNNLIHGGEFADGMPGHGIPWRAPLNVTEYFRDRINGRVYCGIGLRDGENLMCAAKHASKLIGFELLPDSVDYCKREIAKRVVYATAADPSFLMPPYRIFQADLFNFTRETVPKADFLLWMDGRPSIFETYGRSGTSYRRHSSWSQWPHL